MILINSVVFLYVNLLLVCCINIVLFVFMVSVCNGERYLGLQKKDITMATRSVGALAPFDPSKMQWTSYSKKN